MPGITTAAQDAETVGTIGPSCGSRVFLLAPRAVKETPCAQVHADSKTINDIKPEITNS